MKKLLKVLASLALVVVVILSLPNYGGINTKGLKIKSQSNLRNISLGYRVYSQDHNGNLPSSFRELYPKYLDEKSVFYCQGLKGLGGYLPHDVEGALIEYTSVYRDAMISKDLHILHEQPGMWDDGTICYLILEKRDGEWDWKNGETNRVSHHEFERILAQRLAQNFIGN
jgi:hypothetical protein